MNALTPYSQVSLFQKLRHPRSVNYAREGLTDTRTDCAISTNPGVQGLDSGLQDKTPDGNKVSLRPFKAEQRGFWINKEAPNFWLIIHGLNSSPEQGSIKHLAEGIDEVILVKQGNEINKIPSDIKSSIGPCDQVLFLDWSEAAKSNIINAGPLGSIPQNYEQVAGRVKDVGLSMSKILRNAEINPKRVNIIAHSLGSYVAAYGANALGKVKTITLLDAAPTYNPPNYTQPIDILEDAPKFNKVSRFSTQFGSTTHLGTHDTSAHESYWVDFKGKQHTPFDATGAHGEVIRWFIDNVKRPLKTGTFSKYKFLVDRSQYEQLGLTEDLKDPHGWEGTIVVKTRDDEWLTSEPDVHKGKKDF